MSYITTKNQYISVAGNQIAYRELGKDKSKLPLVMLVHLAATLDNWDPKLLDLLAEDVHVIVLDLPGVGASQGKVGQAHVTALASRPKLIGVVRAAYQEELIRKW